MCQRKLCCFHNSIQLCTECIYHYGADSNCKTHTANNSEHLGRTCSCAPKTLFIRIFRKILCYFKWLSLWIVAVESVSQCVYMHSSSCYIKPALTIFRWDYWNQTKHQSQSPSYAKESKEALKTLIQTLTKNMRPNYLQLCGAVITSIQPNAWICLCHNRNDRVSLPLWCQAPTDYHKVTKSWIKQRCFSYSFTFKQRTGRRTTHKSTKSKKLELEGSLSSRKHWVLKWYC